MRIKLDPSVLRETSWYEYAIRFLFGGLITAGTGLIAKEFGAVIGGLFLAFPAILPASATLIAKHEREKKGEHGLHGSARARKTASVDAAGASLGSLGLVAFARLGWRLLNVEIPWLVLLFATTAWMIVSVVAWQIRKRV
jgi:hypothetical protein